MAAISCFRVSAGIQAMSCQRLPPTVVCIRRMRAGENWGRGRRDQHRCHSLVKAVQCWWAPAAASLSTLARRHQLSDYTHGETDRCRDRLYVSHTKCASLVTDAQRQRSGKKTLILTTRGHWRRDDRDQLVAWRHDHRSLKWSHEHSPTNEFSELFPMHTIKKIKISKNIIISKYHKKYHLYFKYIYTVSGKKRPPLNKML